MRCRIRQPRSRKTGFRRVGLKHRNWERYATNEEAGRHVGVFRIHASIALVVVLPWVPATPSTQRPYKTCSASHLRPGNIGQASIKDGFKQRVAAGNGVAGDEHVGI